ncbi:DHA2 family efflux MFS transporter permease subunit [Saccharomonospora glauca]|jgi:EmrB/QacA subfamily drug resistance transporter|uniref:Drug resistance transporter, EmrB/QacA subfamily n=1 Tax=Saccharomonospora glauca K62 TaxID=928724 RepID=I1D2T6_9PSEU|nr:DHA2 family efflux MFS transporter permease subunit [Saccharomonospora glauca]EIE99260.1 drug resistance transporter, EmrB/QacA subfamily [Saccharomonospora glauca K62]
MSAGADRIDGRLLGLAFVLVLGTFMASLDSTIVNVGMKTLRAEFAASITEVQWAGTAYLLAVVAAAPMAGWLAERFGPRRTWLGALLVFLAGSAACAFAWSIPSLAGFRVVQGIGGGLLVPTGQALLAAVAGPRRTGRLMSIAGIVPMLAPVLGPILGGVVLRVADWPWLFYLNLPTGLVALLLARRLVPVVPSSGTAGHFDVRGALLLSPGLAVLVLGLTELASNRTGLGPASVAIAVGVVLLAAFVRHALRATRTPLLELRLFTTPPFGSAALALFGAAASVFGTMFLLPLYLQTGRGLTAWETGLLLAPQGVGAALGSLVVNRTIDRLAPRTIVVTGFTVVLVATMPFTRLGELPDALLGLVLLVRGLGTAMIASPVMTVVYGNVDRDRLPKAAGMLNLLNYVGGALGTAVVAVLLEARLATSNAASAFGVAFWCVLGLCGVALLAALRLPGPAPEGRDAGLTRAGSHHRPRRGRAS